MLSCFAWYNRLIVRKVAIVCKHTKYPKQSPAMAHENKVVSRNRSNRRAANVTLDIRETCATLDSGINLDVITFIRIEVD